MDSIIPEMNSRAAVASTLGVFMIESLQYLYKAQRSVQVHTVHEVHQNYT